VPISQERRFSSAVKFPIPQVLPYTGMRSEEWQVSLPHMLGRPGERECKLRPTHTDRECNTDCTAGGLNSQLIDMMAERVYREIYREIYLEI
jgi:hypothetical protein